MSCEKLQAQERLLDKEINCIRKELALTREMVQLQAQIANEKNFAEEVATDIAKKAVTAGVIFLATGGTTTGF